MKNKNIKSEEKNKEKINENTEFTGKSKHNSTDPISESNHGPVPNSVNRKTSQVFEKDTPFNKNTITSGSVNQKKNRFLSIGLALVPIVVLAAMIYFLTSPYGQDLITGGTPLPEITIEKIEFHENQIVAYIRNTGPESVTISQADVNDRIHSAAIEPSQILPRLGDAKVIIPFFWNPAEPYEVGITTSD